MMRVWTLAIRFSDSSSIEIVDNKSTQDEGCQFGLPSQQYSSARVLLCVDDRPIFGNSARSLENTATSSLVRTVHPHPSRNWRTVRLTPCFWSNKSEGMDAVAITFQIKQRFTAH